MTDELPADKRRNGFTGEIEDKPPLTLAPSPADQRKLAADQSDPRPLIDKCNEAVENDAARALGVEVATRSTPKDDITVGPEGIQNEDVPPANTVLVQQGVPVARLEIPEQQTEVHSNKPSPIED